MSGATAVNQQEVLEVFPGVARTVADALARDLEEVTLDSRLIQDLGAESIDFLDMVFRLERLFQVQIPRGRIIEDAGGDLPEHEFERDGHLTDAGLERLKQYLSEVPADRFRPNLKVGDVPLLFTVETFCKVVIRAQRAAGRSR